MSMREKQQQIIEEFSNLSNWEDRYRRIIELGKTLETMPEKLKTDEVKVKGCTSQVWLVANLNEQGKIVFQADSDALIVKGLVALLIKLYSHSSPEEILATPPEFIQTLGFQTNLSPSRANGLVAMIRQIMYYAEAFKTLKAMRS